MVATVNLPGSSHFDYFIGSAEACNLWLEDRKLEHKRLYQGTWTSTYFPAKIVSNKEASTWRYRDGSKVIHFR